MTDDDEGQQPPTPNDWDTLERMLYEWVLTVATTYEQRQSLIPIRDFILERTVEGLNWKRQ